VAAIDVQLKEDSLIQYVVPGIPRRLSIKSSCYHPGDDRPRAWPVKFLSETLDQSKDNRKAWIYNPVSDGCAARRT